jgi:hypothetical protein
MGRSEHRTGGIVGRATLVGTTALLGISLLGASGASAQDYRGTTDQQSACMSDVFRLCSGDIPDVGRIVACLKRERPHLSEGCRAVFGGASTRVASEHRSKRHHQNAEPQQSQGGYPGYQAYQGYQANQGYYGGYQRW